MHLKLHGPKKRSSGGHRPRACTRAVVLCDQVVEAGVAKAKLPLWKLILLGFVAGFYIGFGALLMLNIGVSCPGLASVSIRMNRWHCRIAAVRCTSPLDAASLSHDGAGASRNLQAHGHQ